MGPTQSKLAKVFYYHNNHILKRTSLVQMSLMELRFENKQCSVLICRDLS
jgi:hypothetical protein